MRNIGVIIAHSHLSITQTCRGLDKLTVNEELLNKELEESYSVLAEAVQTVLRKNGFDDAYERLKAFSRGKEITADELREFISELPINDSDKELLLKLKPQDYVGLAQQLAKGIY